MVNIIRFQKVFLKFIFYFVIIVESTLATEIEENNNFIAKYLNAKKIADNGDTEAMLEVFTIFYTSYPELQSKTNEAPNYLMQAAVNGNVFAQFNLGYLQQTGDVFEKNLDKAIFWLKKASNGGHLGSNRQLGFVYLELFLSDKSNKNLYKESKRWFREGANGGDIPSLRQLATGILAYEQEKHDEAVVMLEKAYKNGDAPSARYLGKYSHVYFEKTKNDEYLKKSLDWYQKAAILGDKKSIEWLKINRDSRS